MNEKKDRRLQIATAIGTAMREARMDRHESQALVARRLGVNQTVLSKWELGRSLPDLVEVERVEQILELRRGQLLIRAGLVELTPVPTEAAIESDLAMTDIDRQTLLRLYQVSVFAAARERGSYPGL